jgi:integrase/recombinase XerC/integrase/recombinase XerD
MKPNQLESLRSVCYSVGINSLQQRNEAIVALLVDTRLQLAELSM